MPPGAIRAPPITNKLMRTWHENIWATTRMTNRMFVDTSGFYCYINAADPQHAAATALMQKDSARVTHSYVLAELVALCQARRIDRGLALNFVSAILDDGDLGIVWVVQQLHREALALLRHARTNNIRCAMPSALC